MHSTRGAAFIPAGERAKPKSGRGLADDKITMGRQSLKKRKKLHIWAGVVGVNPIVLAGRGGEKSGRSRN